MLFERKRKLLKKPDPDAERRLREEIAQEGGLEKKDLPAMILSAYFMIIPVVLGLLLLFLLLGRLFFG